MMQEAHVWRLLNAQGRHAPSYKRIRDKPSARLCSRSCCLAVKSWLVESRSASASTGWEPWPLAVREGLVAVLITKPAVALPALLACEAPSSPSVLAAVEAPAIDPDRGSNDADLRKKRVGVD
jgi:hypothetical protein